MATVYFGFAVSDSMFNGDVEISRGVLDIEAVKFLVRQGVVPCLNPTHVPTIRAMRERFGIDVEIPERAPQVSLRVGDRLIVMGVRGLPRLGADRHEYTQEEIDGATFTFSVWEVLE